MDVDDEDYSHQPVSPDELRQALYDAHGGRADPDAVAELVEEMRPEADETADDPEPMPVETREELMESLREESECPVCDEPVAKGQVPKHIVDEHSG